MFTEEVKKFNDYTNELFSDESRARLGDMEALARIGLRKDSLLSTMIYVSNTDAKIRKKLIYDRFMYSNGKIKPRKGK